MTTQDLTQSVETTQTPQAPSLSDPNLSFADYQALRRGEEIKPVEKTPANPSAPPEKAEQKKSGDSEPSENGEVEEDKESDEVEGSEAKADGAQDDDKPKKKGGFQRRIDKLNAAKAAAQQEAEYWRQLALKGAGEPKVEAKAEKPKADATGKPDPDKFESHSDYIEAVANWTAEQKLAARDQKAEEARMRADQQKLASAHIERVKSFSQKTEDFDDVIGEVDHIAVSPAVREIILSSDNGPELMYELAKNPDEYARICKLSPIAAAREIGKIESKIDIKATAEKKPEAKKLTQAPKPIDPVGGGKAQVSHKTPEEMTYAEYEKHRRDQLRRKRG